ncbi:MAG TPA: hypothetical protein DCS97_07150 [Planctomycetes bacterium]|nr:hypothetical protein [Planctomycetota bacterium]
MPLRPVADHAIRHRPAADQLAKLVANAQHTVLVAERQAKVAGNATEAAAFAKARAHLLDAEWCVTEADSAAGAQSTEPGETEAAPTDLPADADQALRLLLAQELDRREDAAGRFGIDGFCKATGVTFGEASRYARGRKGIEDGAKPFGLGLAKAQSVAVAMGYRLELVRIEDEAARYDAAHLRRRLAAAMDEKNHDPDTLAIMAATGLNLWQLVGFAYGSAELAPELAVRLDNALG